MKLKTFFYVVTLVAGLCLCIAGFFVRIKEIGGVMIGIGAGLFGMSLSALFLKGYEQKNPAIKKQNDIESKDERNIMIRSFAKAKSADITQWLIMAVAYITIFIAAPSWVTMSVVMVFVAYHVLTMYFVNKLQKEM